MRRLLAIAIALLLGMTEAAPLFALDAADNLPQCCRRDGRHHCMSAMSGSATKNMATIAPKCPFPKAIATSMGHGFAPSIVWRVGNYLFVQPNAVPQTEARYRVAYSRSGQKRGPPVILL